MSQLKRGVRGYSIEWVRNGSHWIWIPPVAYDRYSFVYWLPRFLRFSCYSARGQQGSVLQTPPFRVVMVISRGLSVVIEVMIRELRAVPRRVTLLCESERLAHKTCGCVRLHLSSVSNEAGLIDARGFAIERCFGHFRKSGTKLTRRMRPLW